MRDQVAEGLPEGLITNTAAISVNIEQIDRVADDELTKLWRVYTTNKSMLANDVGRRLENLFWRIWGNEAVRSSISGSRVAHLFDFISHAALLTNADQISSRPSQQQQPASAPASGIDPAGPPGRHDTSSSALITPEDDDTTLVPSPTPSTRQDSSGTLSVPPTIEEEKSRRRSSSRPPPILKTTRGFEPTQQSKTARILTPTWKTAAAPAATAPFPPPQGPVFADLAIDSSPPPSPTSRVKYSTSPRGHAAVPMGRSASASGYLFRPPSSSSLQQVQNSSPPTSPRSIPPSPSTASSRPIGASKSSTSSKKTTPFVASSATSRRRPALGVRRKSSQSQSSSSSANNASKAPSPRVTPVSPSATVLEGSEASAAPPETSPALDGCASTDARIRSSFKAQHSDLDPKANADKAQHSTHALMMSADKVQPSNLEPGLAKDQTVRRHQGSRSASPVSTSPFYIPAHVRHGAAAAAAPLATDTSLVDPAFRTKFIDRARADLPSIALPTKSRTPLSLASSFQAHGRIFLAGDAPPARADGRDPPSMAKARPRLKQSSPPLRSEKAGPVFFVKHDRRVGQESDDDDDDDDDGDGDEGEDDREQSDEADIERAAGRELPRTKSQLTMLLERDRRNGAEVLPTTKRAKR